MEGITGKLVLTILHEKCGKSFNISIDVPYGFKLIKNPVGDQIISFNEINGEGARVQHLDEVVTVCPACNKRVVLDYTITGAAREE